MIAKASIMKHPIHPMLIPLPIGLWLFSLFCDLAWHRSGNPTWNACALYTMAGGAVGALLAALPGLTDLYYLPERPVKKIAIWHMGINLAIVVLYLVNLRWRFTSAPQIGQTLLSGLAILLLMVSGWLGGEMVFLHGAGVEEERQLPHP